MYNGPILLYQVILNVKTNDHICATPPLFPCPLWAVRAPATPMLVPSSLKTVPQALTPSQSLIKPRPHTWPLALRPLPSSSPQATPRSLDRVRSPPTRRRVDSAAVTAQAVLVLLKSNMVSARQRPRSSRRFDESAPRFLSHACDHL